MKTKHLLLIGIIGLSIAYAGCKKDKKEDDFLDLSYSGVLTLYYTNTYPEFESSKDVNVEISKDGTVTFESGILSYSGEQINDAGDGKMKREGTINISPSGTVYKNQNGDPHLSVDENSVVNDHTIMWVLNSDNQWIEVLNTNNSDTWNGGLDFDMDMALIDGAVVEVNTANGTAKWSLYLLAKLTD